MMALGLVPRLGPEKFPRHEGQFLREVLDRTMQDSRRLDVVTNQNLVEFLLADVLGGLVPERIFAGLAQRLAEIFEDVLKGAFAGAVAQKPVVVLEFDVVTVDVHGRQPRGPVIADSGGRQRVLGHISVPLACWRVITAGEPDGFAGRAPQLFRKPQRRENRAKRLINGPFSGHFFLTHSLLRL